MVRETYHFLRLYIIHLLHNKQVPPVIDRSFLKLVFSTVSDRKGGNKVTFKNADGEKVEPPDLGAFYDTHYKPMQSSRPKAPNKDILDYEITSIITNVENHIKNAFFTYVNRLVFSLAPKDKDERKRLRNDLLDNTRTSRLEFRPMIERFAPLIREKLDKNPGRKIPVFKDNPQSCFPLIYAISKIVRERGFKQLAIVPMRRSLIPSYITIDTNIFKRSFGNLIRKHPLDVWKNIRSVIEGEFGHKEGFVFTSLKTDGVGCSVVFTVPNKWVKGSVRPKKVKFDEKYFEDLKSYGEFKDKKIVGIDPNKGNLVYCFDGEKTLRYTQDERRKHCKVKRYRAIRKEKEDAYVCPDNRTIRGDLKDMMKYNSRSCDPDEFETYLRHKNDFNSRYQDVYKALDFRKLKRNREMNEKRSEARFMSRFRETYGADAVVVFGDWEERPGFLRGKEPTKGKGMRSILRRAGFTVYLLDEFRTSKLCHKCHAADGSGHENESNVFRRADPRPWKQGKSQYIWGLLRCKNERCRCVHNRDFNSASNILRIARTIIDTGERPQVFRRTKPCNPVPVQDHGGVRRDSNIPLLTTND